MHPLYPWVVRCVAVSPAAGGPVIVGAATAMNGCISKDLRLMSALVNRAIRNRSRQMVHGTGASTVAGDSQYGWTPAMQESCWLRHVVYRQCNSVSYCKLLGKCWVIQGMRIEYSMFLVLLGPHSRC